MNIDTNIQKTLTVDEKELFSVIKQVIEKFTPSTQAFVVGGWVRDKLIRTPSSDIDVMIDNMSGGNFAKLITNYLKIKDAHVIKENPEKSKFISTAKAYIPLSSGTIQEVDFAQARSEVYTDNSRIPDIKPATPKKDAYRRDLTINSIFYNIKENKIEDFTGMGIKDLISNVIRTPQDPIKTFMDDPLRIFRCIRFSAKYNGTMDPQTYAAISSPNIKNEIKKKVSKERIGQEFIKMLKAPNPEYALKLLKDTGLWQDIMEESLRGTKYEGKMSSLDMDQKNIHHTLTVWEHSLQVVKNVLDRYPDADPEKRVVIIMSALMHDLGKLYTDIQAESKSHPGNKSYHGHEDESKQIAIHILKFLKIEPYIQQVSGIAEHHMRLHQFTEQEQGGQRALRKFLRNMGESSLDWLDVLNIATADAYSKGLEINPETIKKYQELEQNLQKALLSLSPVKDTSIKPILDGNEIMSILDIKPGIWMSNIKNFVKELKDENPNITKEEAAKLIKDKFQNINTNEIKKASKEESKNTTCSAHLLNAKLKEINALLKVKEYYKILTILDELRNNYRDDENIVRLLAITTLKILIKDSKFRHNNLLEFIFDKAKKNFFDSSLCAYVAGILILIETKVDKRNIRLIAKRTMIMNPTTFKKVLNMLPNKVYNEDIKKEFICE